MSCLCGPPLRGAHRISLSCPSIWFGAICRLLVVGNPSHPQHGVASSWRSPCGAHPPGTPLVATTGRASTTLTTFLASVAMRLSVVVTTTFSTPPPQVGNPLEPNIPLVGGDQVGMQCATSVHLLEFRLAFLGSARSWLFLAYDPAETTSAGPEIPLSVLVPQLCLKAILNRQR